METPQVTHIKQSAWILTSSGFIASSAILNKVVCKHCGNPKDSHAMFHAFEPQVNENAFNP